MTSDARAALLGPQGEMSRGWKISWWILSSLFLLSAALNMLGYRAGFLTNHLADVVVPAWIYVGIRHVKRSSVPIIKWTSETAARAAVVIFLCSVMTELTQLVWPGGVFSGTFDVSDIAAFAAGIIPVYLADRFIDRS